MNPLVTWLLEGTADIPWPWRMIFVAGLPLTLALIIARTISVILLLAEGAITARRRFEGRSPGPLTHAISDGLDLSGHWLKRLVWVPLALSVGTAVVIGASAEGGADWAIDLEQRMVDYADRVIRAGDNVG